MDLGEFLEHALAVFPEEMAPVRSERAKLPTKHRFADVPVTAVTAAFAIELLFSSVVDARNAKRGGIKAHDRQYERPAAADCKSMLLAPLIDMVMVVDGGDNLIA